MAKTSFGYKFIDTLDIIQKVVLILSTSVVLVLLGTSIICRYILHVNMYGLEELVQMAGYYLYFMGAGFSVRLGYEIKADMVDIFPVRQKVKGYIHAAANVISVILAFLFVYWGFLMIEWGVEVNPVTPGLRLPVMISYIGVEAGFVFGFTYTLINAYKFFKLLKCS